jgi:hypothetical protein
MARRCDEVQQDVHTVVAEARVTLDTRLLGDDAIVLALEVSDDFLEATSGSARTYLSSRGTYLASLSTWSPNPGVSTMVSEMRVPSSSSSGTGSANCAANDNPLSRHTDGDGLDLDALLNVCRGGVVRLLMLEDLLATESVHEGCPPGA